MKLLIDRRFSLRKGQCQRFCIIQARKGGSCKLFRYLSNEYQQNGYHENIIPLLGHHGFSVQEAYNNIQDLLRSCFKAWYLALANLPSWGETTDRDIQRYIKGIEDVIIGLAHFRWLSSPEFRSTNAEIVLALIHRGILGVIGSMFEGRGNWKLVLLMHLEQSPRLRKKELKFLYFISAVFQANYLFSFDLIIILVGTLNIRRVQFFLKVKSFKNLRGIYDDNVKRGRRSHLFLFVMYFIF